MRAWSYGQPADGCRLDGSRGLGSQRAEIAALSHNEDKVVEILRKCARDYFLKLPQVKQQIQQLLKLERIDSPRVQAIMSGTDLQAVGAGIGDGLWTPESAAAAGLERQVVGSRRD